MENLFEHDNYIKWLNDLVYGPMAARGLQVRLAQAMGCQPAYLSQVLREKAHLTEDHTLKLTVFLKFNETATDYLLTMVRLGRAATGELRAHLLGQMRRLQRQNQEVSSKIKAKSAKVDQEKMLEYFATWIPSTVHTATASEQYQDVKALQARFGLSREKVDATLQLLEALKLVKREGSRFVYSGESLHFPRNSPVHLILQVLRREQAIASIHKETLDDLHFSTIFTIDATAARELRELALSYIESAQKRIHAAGTDELYSICLDFFKVP